MDTEQSDSQSDHPTNKVQKDKYIDEVENMIEEMRQKGPIFAHPMMYVSALHNKHGSYPVNQNDNFYTKNNIEFIELANLEENGGWNPPEMKYRITVDESGAFRHSLAPV